MIDTDKYENWTDDFHVWEQYVKDIDYEPDRLLIADAPLLLEAYRELRDYHAALLHWVMYHLDKDEDEVKEMIYE